MATSVLRVWCLRLSETTPPFLVEHLRSGLAAKTTPPPLRVGYLHCLLALCGGEGAVVVEELQTVLAACVERASGPAHLPSAAEEGLVASSLLWLSGAVPAAVWELLDGHCEQLLSPKVTSTATQESLRVLVQLAERVLCSQEQKLRPASQREWLAAVVHVTPLLSWEQRKPVARLVSRAVLLEPPSALVVLEAVSAELEREIPAWTMMPLLLSLAEPTLPNKETLAAEMLLVTHHPAIVVLNRNAWEQSLRLFQLEPAGFVAGHIAGLLAMTSSAGGRCESSALRTLAKLEPQALGKQTVSEVTALLSSAAVLNATSKELEIMSTPPGRLWHTGLRKELEAGLGGTVEANMKKESKTYSFEDQKWDAEVRAEQLLKRKDAIQKEDISTLIRQAKLTPKQQHAIEEQLSQETAIRSRLRELDVKLSRSLLLLEALPRGELAGCAPRLVPVLVAALGSPLAGRYCRTAWLALSHAIFPDWETAQLFSEVSLDALSGSVPSSLPRLLASLQALPPAITPSHPHMAHTLTIPLLNAIISGSHGFSIGSHDLKASATSVLCKAVNSFAASYTWDSTDVFPAVETIKMLSAVIATPEDSIRARRMKKSCVEALCALVPVVFQDVLSQLTALLLDPCPLLRTAVLQAMATLDPSHFPCDHAHLLVALLVARHDSEEENETLASQLWESAGCERHLSASLEPVLLEQVCGCPLVLQDAVAGALAVWLQGHVPRASSVLELLTAAYTKRRTAPPPQTDSFGRAILIEYTDKWEGRVGVAKALEQLPHFLDAAHSMQLLQFIIPGALQDPRSEVVVAFMAAARATISTHGESLATELMAHFEQCLAGAGNTKEADAVRQSVVVLMGALARHMDKENPKVKSVVHLLLSNLDTPSQQVQEAIAGCLPPLATVIKPEAETIIKKLMEKLLESPSFSQRNGAAYGLAGLVKGLGIMTLKQLQVMSSLQEAIKDKKNYRHREGALLAFQQLCHMLGRLFEPYVVHLLPDLLLCFGDGNQYVREATDQTARTIMANLSSHGVKLILPSLLTALDEDSWRTKAGSAELLGAMAFCAPKQLSSCLPSIVPQLMDVLADSHSKVHQAGSQALRQIGSVIKNPEIQVLVPVLLEALADPSNKAQTCLQALLDTEFVHVIDPPSLALIMPTLTRTLELRSTDTKKMAAQIIGNMYSLTDRKDLAPYLPDMLPALKQSLIDPVPEVRAVCAKALGAMARAMGDEPLGDLLKWLIATLTSEASSVDRSGAAQGMSEVLLTRGVEHLKQLMPKFIASSQDASNSTHVRDGYLMMFVYLPVTFGDQFIVFIGEILPCVLKGLADESEFIRETALQAGQTIVNRYADTAVELFLPQLESGVFDDNWRIRCSSVQLLGDLLYRISGLSGKMSTESGEDDNFGTEEARQALLSCLGLERRNRVLAGLYMGRSDVALLVRQASLHVWKIVVTNTARTLREILPTLISLLLGCLASESYDKRKVAARTLGDLVRKLGERVLPEVIPMLEQGLASRDPQERQGVCIGLSEIIQQTSREHVLLYVDSLLPTVRSALCDSQEEVRAAAAMTFDSLHSTVGPRILEEVLTPLLSQLGDEESQDVVLDGLKQVMAIKSRAVLPHIVPQLIRPPVNIKALSLLCSVAGDALHKYLDRIVPALIGSLEGTGATELWVSADAVVLSVRNEPGPANLIEELFKAGRSGSPERRVASLSLLYCLCSQSAADLTDHLPQLMIFTTEALNDPDDTACEKAWLGLDAVVKRIYQKELPHYTGYLRKALRTVSSNLIGAELRGFTLKGITPALTVLKEGLINGSPDEKEESARVLVEVIRLSAPQTLSTGKVVMLIAGPLIRVLGDRYGWNVKVATLEALIQLVRKVGVAAKSFIPQLQTSYLKALNDPNRPVRVQATIGLTELMPLSPRADPVFNDLHNGIKKNEDLGLRQTMLQALRDVTEAAGQRMSEKHRVEILSTLVALQATAQESHRLMAASCAGVLCAHLTDTELIGLLSDSLLVQDVGGDWAVLQARAASLTAALTSASPRLAALGLGESIAEAVARLALSDRVPVGVSGLQAVGSYLNHMQQGEDTVLPALTQGLTHSSVDVRVAASEVCGGVVSPSDRLLATALPLLLSNTREKNTAVRASAEHAIVDLVRGDAQLKRCVGLLDVATGRRLEEVHVRVQARLARDL